LHRAPKTCDNAARLSAVARRQAGRLMARRAATGNRERAGWSIAATGLKSDGAIPT